MNSRIRELIEQCSRTSTSYFDGRGNVTETHFDKEKFAELIVQECVEVLEHRHKTFAGSKSEYSNGFRSGLDAATRTVKRHFGVES